MRLCMRYVNITSITFITSTHNITAVKSSSWVNQSPIIYISARYLLITPLTQGKRQIQRIQRKWCGQQPLNNHPQQQQDIRKTSKEWTRNKECKKEKYSNHRKEKIINECGFFSHRLLPRASSSFFAFEQTKNQNPALYVYTILFRHQSASTRVINRKTRR